VVLIICREFSETELKEYNAIIPPEKWREERKNFTTISEALEHYVRHINSRMI